MAILFPAALDTEDSLIRTTDNALTTLNGNITSGAVSMTVVSTSAFPSTGTMVIDSEIISYTGKTGTTFTGLSRGVDGTTPAAHLSGVAVKGSILSLHKRTLDAAIIAIETKLGAGRQDFIDGAGVAAAYALWADTNTLQSGYLKQESNALTMDGAGSAPEIRLMTNGLAGATNRTLGVLYADANVVELTARRNGSFLSQETAIRLNALGSTAVVQIAQNGTVVWTFDGDTLLGRSGLGTIGGSANPIVGVVLKASNGVYFYNSGAFQSRIGASSLDTISLYDSSETQAARLNYGPSIYLQAVAGSPEGVVTANIGSVVSRTNGSGGISLYIKESGTGNTGWVPLAGASDTAYDATSWNANLNVPTKNVVRDQFEALAAATIPSTALLRAYLASDVVYNNTTTLTNTSLSVTLEAGKTYDIDLVVHSTSAEFSLLLDFGGTATATNFRGQWWASLTSNASGDVGLRITAIGTDYQNGNLDGLDGYYTFRGTIEVNAGGTFILRGAQRSPAESDTTILRGSTLIVTQLN